MPYDDILAMMLARSASPALANNTTPDHSDGGRVLPDPQPFKEGGKAEKEPASNGKHITLNKAKKAPEPQSAPLPVQQFEEGVVKKATGGSIKRVFKKAQEFLNQPQYHGGSYQRGDVITQPLYMTPNKEMAQSFVDPTRIPGSQLQELKPQVNNPAPERLVQAAIRKHVPENVHMGYTPATAFDPNLHEYKSIQALIDELTRRGYDSAIAHDIGMGSSIPSGPALVAFPGTKAYRKGGEVEGGGAAFGIYPKQRATPSGEEVKRVMRETVPEAIQSLLVPSDVLDVAMMVAPWGKVGKLAAAGLTAMSPMEAEAGKVKTAVDLGRRSLFGLRPTQDMAGRELAPLKQATQDLKAAPKIEEKTTTFTPSPDAPKVESTLKSLAETPVSRRTVLKSATGQVMQHALPGMSEITQAVNPVASVVQQAAAPAFTEAMIPGLVAEGLKMGYSLPRVMKMVEGELGTGMKNMNQADVDRMYHNMMDPYSATDMNMFPNYTSAGDAWRSLTGVESAFGRPFSQLRQSMSAVKKADPELYETLKNAARDVEKYGSEP